MTVIITKTKLALGILAMVLVGATVVAASDGVFTDNPSGTYYHDPVEWAYDNGITTGTSDTTFSPMDPVTRGQNVTFAYRYDTNVVQPALEALQTVVGVATVKADGSVVAARSSGVTDTNVSLDSTSAFCFEGLDFTFTSVQVSPLYEGDERTHSMEVGYADTTGFGLDDCDSTDAVLEIATLIDGSWAPAAFTVTFFG